ncbi:MAG: glycosyltransferase family 39 protein [Candidatus Omnitrophica bacterium]|nr:glycosyltransferase family 39 protein [Candidatus Omnitrophota bacterium]
MTNILPYFLEYFKTNDLTKAFVIVLLVLAGWKYLRIPFRISPKKIFILIFALVLALRVFWLFFSSYTPKTHWDPMHMLESDVTNMHALDLTRGVWFRWADGSPGDRRPIGYPMLVGLMYTVFGTNPWVAYTLNLALYALAAWLVFLMARLIFGEPVGLLAMFLFSIWPVSVYSIKLITDEHLFLPVWYGGLYLLLREAKGRPARWPLLWYGVFFGYAAMTRTHAVFMPFVVAFTYFLMKKPWRHVLVAFFTVALLMQVVNLPWIIRNYRAFKAPVLYTVTGDGLYGWVNSNATPEMNGAYPKPGDPEYAADFEEARLNGDRGKAHTLGSREIRHWILRHPAKFVTRGIARVLVFMGWNRTGGVWPIWFQYYEGSYDPKRPMAPAVKEALEEISFASYYILLFSFIFSVAFLWKRRAQIPESSRLGLGVLAACLFFWWCEHMIVFPDRKYRFPLEPLMIIATSPFFYYLLTEFRFERLVSRFVKPNSRTA